MARKNTNARILKRFERFIVHEKEGKEKCTSTLLQRSAYAEAVMELFSFEDETRRNMRALRKLYIYKVASRKNLLEKHVYPSYHFEDWLLSTILQATQNITKVMKLFQTTVAFLAIDTSSKDLFAIEKTRSLDLIPTPASPTPCAIHFRQFVEVVEQASTMPFFCGGGSNSDSEGERERLIKEAEAEREERRREREAERERERAEREAERARHRAGELIKCL